MAVKASANITLFHIIDIDSTTIYYLLQSSTANPPAKPTTDNPGGNWTTTEPTYTEGSTNTLYTVTKTKFSDGTFEYTPVSKSSSYEAAKSAYNKAYNAENTLNNYISSKDIIVGTQTVSTRFWTGNSQLESLQDGDEILYWLPYTDKAEAASSDKTVGVDMRVNSTTTKTAGTLISSFESSSSSNAWINLTLKDGSTKTGWIPLYYSGSTRMTTHYSAGNCIRLVYRVNANVNGVQYTGFFGDANYVGNDTYDRIRFNNSIKAKSAISASRLIVGDDNGYFHLLAGVIFKIDNPILWANDAIAANSTGSNNYLSRPSLTMRNNTNSSWTATQYKTLYLVGVLNGDMFTVDSTPFTTTTPTTEDGKYYISLGYMASTYQIYLYPEHPIYKYVNGSFKNLNQVAYEAQYGIDNLTIGGRNLIKGTSKEWKPISVTKNYGTILSSNDFFGLNVGDEYTVKYKLKSNSGKELIMRIQFYTDQDHRTSIYNNDLSIQNSEGYLYITSVLTEAQRNYTRMEIFIDANRTAGTITATTTEYYSELKLEKGNRATDWSPAPEDSDNVVSQDTAPTDTSAVWFNTSDNLFYKYNGEHWIAISDYNEDISKLKEDVGKIDSTIDGKINDYDAEVQRTYYTKTQVDSQIESNERGIKEYYSGTISTIQSNAAGLTSRVTAIEGYIQKGLDDNGQPFIELGTGSSPYKLKITNDAIQITYFGEPVSNWEQDLIELNTVITSYLNLGKFSFVINGDDSVSFRKIR